MPYWFTIMLTCWTVIYPVDSAIQHFKVILKCYYWSLVGGGEEIARFLALKITSEAN